VPQTGNDVAITNSDAINRIITYSSTVGIHSLLIHPGENPSLVMRSASLLRYPQACGDLLPQLPRLLDGEL